MSDEQDSYSDSEEQTQVSSKINSAALVNLTLNNLWGEFFNHYRNGLYLSSNSDLDCIWTILGGEKDMEKSETESTYLKIEKELGESGNLSDGIITKGFKLIDDKFIEKLKKQKSLLLKKSLFLRRLQNKQGKGTAYHKPDEDDFD